MPHRSITPRAAAALACAAALTSLLPSHRASAADDTAGERSVTPSTTVPSTTVASTTIPSTTVPSTTSPSTTGPSTVTPSTAGENIFIPESRALDECISSLPKPECGSAGRGGWRQSLVFAVMLAGMAAIGVRIAFSLRRRDRRNAHP